MWTNWTNKWQKPNKIDRKKRRGSSIKKEKIQAKQKKKKSTDYLCLVLLILFYTGYLSIHSVTLCALFTFLLFFSLNCDVWYRYFYVTPVYYLCILLLYVYFASGFVYHSDFLSCLILSFMLHRCFVYNDCDIV